MNRYDILLGKKLPVKKSTFPFRKSLTRSEIEEMLKKPPIYGHPFCHPFLESLINNSVLTISMRREKVENIKVKEDEMIRMPSMTLGVRVPPPMPYTSV